VHLISDLSATRERNGSRNRERREVAEKQINIIIQMFSSRRVEEFYERSEKGKRYKSE
jgi:hypothetical protein